VRVIEIAAGISLAVFFVTLAGLIYELIAFLCRYSAALIRNRHRGWTSFWDFLLDYDGTRAQSLRRKVLIYAFVPSLVLGMVLMIVGGFLAPGDPNYDICLTIGGLVTNLCTD
jgi:hypothetical protein